MKAQQLAWWLLATPLLLAADCGGGEPCDEGWREHAPAGTPDRVVLSAAHAPGSDAVYFVGGGLGVPGAKALAALGDAASWTELPVGDHDETLWWAWVAPGPATDVWMVGERGLVLRWDGTSFTELDSGTDATLFGVWGSASDDVWIVGGTAGTTAGEDGVIAHWNGSAFAHDDSAPVASVALFKVWGTSANNVWFVGEGGTLLNRQNGSWFDYRPGMFTDRNVLTVHGCAADDVWAVAGQDLLHFDGVTWAKPAEPVLLSDANGVSCAGGSVLVVGNGGMKWRRDAAGTWFDEQFSAPFDTDFHGALVVDDASMWAVGGSFNAPVSAGARKGVLGRFARSVCQ